MTHTADIFQPDMLAGQVALVTGGGTGIGFGIASCLAAAGVDVVIASRKPDHLEPAAERIRAAGFRVSTVAVNVREPESVAQMVHPGPARRSGVLVRGHGPSAAIGSAVIGRAAAVRRDRAWR